MITFINFKNYPSGLGIKQMELLDFLEELPLNSQSSPSTLINLVVPPTELAPIWQKYNFPLWSQHCDPVKTSRATGWISAEQIKEAGGIGTMLNHSEHRLPFHVLRTTTQICHEHGLKVLICCENEKEAKIYSGLHPEYLAFEPPELIANKTQSVTSKSEEIRKIVSFLSSSLLRTTDYRLQTKFLVGAGIHSRENIEESEKLGASGVLISSIIMEAQPRTGGTPGAWGSQEEIKKLLNPK